MILVSQRDTKKISRYSASVCEAKFHKFVLFEWPLFTNYVVIVNNCVILLFEASQFQGVLNPQIRKFAGIYIPNFGRSMCFVMQILKQKLRQS